MASYVGLVKVIFTLIVAFFAVLVNLISHVFNYFDGWWYPDKPVAPRRRRRPQPVNRPLILQQNNAGDLDDDDSSDDGMMERASRRL